jgi:hypothetical protein
MTIPFGLVLLWISGIFGWNAWRGVRSGRVRVPVQLFEIDEYERDHTLFWGIVGLDVILSVLALTASIYCISLSLK